MQENLSLLFRMLIAGRNFTYCRMCFSQKVILILIAGSLLMQLSASAQSPYRVSGVVKNSIGEIIPDISIKVKGSSAGVVTDINGKFSIELQGRAILVFTAIGFDTKEVIANKATNDLDIQMSGKSEELNQVVVIGYGTQKKSDLTGAVSSIKARDFNNGVNTSPEQLIMGKAAGVRTVQSGGEPGAGLSISVRGASSITAGTEPLYVIDGLPLQNQAAVGGGGPGFSSSFTPRSPLSTLNPQDIASIEILKDASATAIYGSRGANGVVLITTKSGLSGKLKIDYDGYAGIQNPFRQPVLLSPEQYMTTVNDLITAGAGTAADRVTGIIDGGTDWQQKLYNENSVFHSHNITFSGGDKSTRYLVSLSNLNQPGVLINSALNRYSGRINLDHTIADKFNLGIRMTTSYDKDKYLPNGTGFNETAGALNAALNYDPTLPVSDNNGKYTISPFITVDNPLAIANGYRSDGNRYQTLGNVFAEYYFIPGLSAKINLGINNYEEQRKTYISRVSQFGLASGGIANLLQGHRSNYLTEFTMHYHKVFGKNTLDALGGTSFQKFINTNSVASAKGFPSDAVGAENLALGNPALATNSSNKASNQLLSYIGRVNYSILDRYLLTATLRVDGSSRFGINNKYAYFPSFAAGWKISSEEFFTPLLNTFNSLKLRASWGRTGNQDIGNYNSIATYASGQLAVFNGQITSTIIPSGLSNPDLKWETTQQFDAGLDFGILNNRISASVDYYQKRTYDMLINLPIDPSTGFATQLTNIGSIKNEGFEFTISSENLVDKLKWRTELNLSTIKNTVLNIGPLSQIIQGSSIIQVGSPLRSFYGYQVLGTWQTGDKLSSMRDVVLPGNPKYFDVNNDSVINTNDRVLLGNSFPKFSFGVNNFFSYKNFEFNFFFDGVSGIEKYNINLAEALAPANIRRNRYAEPFLNRWTTTNPTNEWPSFVRQQGSREVSTYTVTNASYFRLNNMQLSYNIPGKLTGKSFRSIRVYAAAQNVFIITNYLGDPTLNTGGNANLGDSNNPYPLAKTFLAGINVGL